MAKPVSATPSSRPTPKPRLSARLRVQYDYRSMGKDTDNDLYGFLRADARDLYGGRLDFYASARAKSDLDKKASSDSLANDPLQSVDEADGVTENRLLQLYADMHGLDRKLSTRLGRQYVDVADYLHLDGGQILYDERGDIGGRAYFGQPVSSYTSVSGDYAGGLSVVGRPWEGNRTRITLARYHDDSEDDDDQHYFLDIRQEISDALRTREQLSMLNDEFRMARMDWYLYTPDGETDFSLGASYWGSFDANTRAFSPLYNTLGEQSPYTHVHSRLTQQIAPGWMISPGASLRLTGDTENSENNRDYENYDLALIYEPTRTFSTSLSLEYWEVERGESFMGLSGEARYRRGREWEVSGGASFAQFTYDTYSDLAYSANGGQVIASETGTVYEESPYVYTYFLRWKWKMTRRLVLRLQGDIEDDDQVSYLAYRGRASVEVRY